MVGFGPLRLNSRRALALPLLRSSSSVAARDIPADASSARSPEASPKPRTLSSIFARPVPANPKTRKTTAPAVTSRKDRVLSSNFERPVPANPNSRKTTAPAVTSRKERASFRPSPLPRILSRFRSVKEKNFIEPLLPEVEMLVSQLQEEGYLKDANFLHGGLMEPRKIPDTLYSRQFVKAAAEKFGQDHQEIAKWLSGGDLKKVTLFGCPSMESKTVFAAKRLRSFFKIQEDIACRGCQIKDSCKFMNQEVGGQHKVILADVMRILILFAFNSIPQQLFVSDDLKHSVGKLLKEVINLSR